MHARAVPIRTVAQASRARRFQRGWRQAHSRKRSLNVTAEAQGGTHSRAHRQASENPQTPTRDPVVVQDR